MSKTAFFLRNRYSVWAMVVAIVFLGFGAYRQIPVRLFPDTAPPLVNIVTAWPGATAADVDRDLSDLLDTEFSALEGVVTTSASSQDNLSIIQVEFQYDTDVKRAAIDVQNAVSRISEDLPDGAQQPRVLTFSTANRPIYTLGIAADDLLHARKIAEDFIAPRLQSVAGVAAVDVFGGRVPSVFVDVDPTLAQAHHIALPMVAAAVQSNNVSLPAGRVRAQSTETMLRVDQRRSRVEDLEDIPLQLPDGSQLRLGNVASAYHGAEIDDSWFSINGKRTIAVQVFRSEDANTVEVVGLVRKLAAELEREFPEITFIEGEESASFTEQSVSNLLSNVWEALLLASVILFLFLGRARAALVTAFTMPLAFGLTFAVMWKMGMEFNMVTLSAVILAVGMVVDDSVVVLESIMRLRSEGKSPMDAAREGTDQVWGPVLTGTITTLAVLVPLLGLQGFIGKVFGPLAMTLLIAFTSSIFVALILVPILSLQVKEEGRIERAAATISYPFRAAMDVLRNGYLHLLSFGLRYRSVILIVSLLSFGGGIYGLRSIGMNLLPRMDGGAFTISFETPSGTSLQETTKIVKKIEALLSKQTDIVLVQSQAGFEPGMKFSGGSGVMGPTQGFLSISLSPRTTRERTIWDIEEEVRAGIDTIPGIVNVVVKEVGNTAKPTTLAPVVARISGPDTLVLEKLGKEVVQRLGKVNALVEPTPVWRRDMKRIIIQIDEKHAAAYGQNARSVAQQLAMGAEGIPAGNFTTELASAQPISVRYAPAQNPGVDEMLSWPIFLPSSGQVLPLREIATPKTVIEQGLYSSVDLSPVLDIHAGVSGRPLNFVVADANEALKSMSVPQGYKVAIEGENKDLEKSRTSILGALIISVLAVYLLLVAQFRSWVHPITVMMAIPLSISGVALALWLVGKPVSMPVMVGLVLLVGTVVNNAILLVDVIRQKRDGGASRHDAIIDGVRSRFRPIMMTSFSTIIGMLPLAMELALGAERFSPLAVAVIGGLLVSTLLTMLVIPILYDTADRFRWPFGKGKNSSAKVIATIVIVAASLGLPSTAAAQEAAKSVTLEQAWQLTLQHPAAMGADSKVHAAKETTRAAKRRMYPSAEITGRISELSYVEPALIAIPLMLPDGSMAPPVQLGESIERQFSLGASLTQPIYTGGALTQSRKAAAAALKAARAGKRATEADLWYGLAAGWYSLAVAEKLVAIQEAQLSSARAREASTTRLKEMGRATELELSSVALKRAEAQERVLEAKNALQVATYSLESFLGTTIVRPSLDIVALAQKAEGPALAPGRSPALDKAYSLADAAKAKAKAAKAPLYPALAFRLHGEYSNPNTRYFPVKSEFNGSWDASLLLNWKLDFGVTKSESKRAQLEASAARFGANALERQTKIEIGKSLSSLQLAPSQLAVAAERIALAKRAVAAAERAVAQGRSTQTEVLEREAQLGLAQAAQQKTALTIVLAAERARTLRGDYGPR